MSSEKELLWKRVEDRIGGELGTAIVKELRELYSHIDRRMLRWAAGLYDHGIGGFYYCNSARDTEGFLPDIESTWDHLVLSYSLGAMKNYGDTLEQALRAGYPDWLKEKVLNYFLGLQHPDGFFYHPQWQKESHTISRLGRDRGSATTMIRAFGGKPKYELASPLSEDKKELVPERYHSEENFREYLDSLDIKHRSYHAISQVLTQIPQIKAYGEGLGVDLFLITENWLVDNMNPENGLWQDEVTRYSVNGMHKATRIFNSRARAIPYAARGVESTLSVIFSDEEDHAVVDIYNPWHVLSDMLHNMRTYGDGETKKEAERLARRVLESAPEAIRISTKKILEYQYPDGSFSYLKGRPSSSNQGMPSAVPGLPEGDANGNGCAVVGLIPSIWGALGIPELLVPVFDEDDFKYYLSLLDEKRKEYEREHG